MKKPELLLVIDKYLTKCGVKKNPSFTTKFLIEKIKKEADAASKNLKAKKEKALRENLINIVFLMTSISCIKDINPLEEINKRIKEVKKGYHPILDEFMKSR